MTEDKKDVFVMSNPFSTSTVHHPHHDDDALSPSFSKKKRNPGLFQHHKYDHPQAAKKRQVIGENATTTTTTAGTPSPQMLAPIMARQAIDINVPLVSVDEKNMRSLVCNYTYRVRLPKQQQGETYEGGRKGQSASSACDNYKQTLKDTLTNSKTAVQKRWADHIRAGGDKKRKQSEGWGSVLLPTGMRSSEEKEGSQVFEERNITESQSEKKVTLPELRRVLRVFDTEDELTTTTTAGGTSPHDNSEAAHYENREKYDCKRGGEKGERKKESSTFGIASSPARLGDLLFPAREENGSILPTTTTTSSKNDLTPSKIAPDTHTKSISISSSKGTHNAAPVQGGNTDNNKKKDGKQQQLQQQHVDGQTVASKATLPRIHGNIGAHQQTSLLSQHLCTEEEKNAKTTIKSKKADDFSAVGRTGNACERKAIPHSHTDDVSRIYSQQQQHSPRYFDERKILSQPFTKDTTFLAEGGGMSEEEEDDENPFRDFSETPAIGPLPDPVSIINAYKKAKKKQKEQIREMKLAVLRTMNAMANIGNNNNNNGGPVSQPSAASLKKRSSSIFGPGIGAAATTSSGRQNRMRSFALPTPEESANNVENRYETSLEAAAQKAVRGVEKRRKRKILEAQERKRREQEQLEREQEEHEEGTENRVSFLQRSQESGSVAPGLQKFDIPSSSFFLNKKSKEETEQQQLASISSFSSGDDDDDEDVVSQDGTGEDSFSKEENLPVQRTMSTATSSGAGEKGRKAVAVTANDRNGKRNKSGIYFSRADNGSKGEEGQDPQTATAKIQPTQHRKSSKWGERGDNQQQQQQPELSSSYRLPTVVSFCTPADNENSDEMGSSSRASKQQQQQRATRRGSEKNSDADTGSPAMAPGGRTSSFANVPGKLSSRLASIRAQKSTTNESNNRLSRKRSSSSAASTVTPSPQRRGGARRTKEKKSKWGSVKENMTKNAVIRSLQRVRSRNVFIYKKEENSEDLIKHHAVEELVELTCPVGLNSPDTLRTLVAQYCRMDTLGTYMVHMDDVMAFHREYKWTLPPFISDVIEIRKNKSGVANLIEYLLLMLPYLPENWILQRLRKDHLPTSKEEYEAYHWAAKCRPRFSLLEIRDLYDGYGGSKHVRGLNYRKFLLKISTAGNSSFGFAEIFKDIKKDDEGFVSFRTFAEAMWKCYSEEPFPEKEFGFDDDLEEEKENEKIESEAAVDDEETSGQSQEKIEAGIPAYSSWW